MLIGDKKEFAISFVYHSEEFFDDPMYIENETYYREWIEAELWVKNKNLFAFKDNHANETYAYNFIILLNFFCEFLYFQLTDEPFPISCKATSAIEIFEETKLIKDSTVDDTQTWAEFDWDSIDMDTENERWEWYSRRCFTPNRDGSFLPHICFRKLGDKIEISWKNKNPHNNGRSLFYFQYEQGVELVDIKLYKEVIISFCQHLCHKFESLYPKLIADCRKELQKAIEVAV